MKLRRTIFLILIIINCITIFYFSNQVANVSSGSSGRIVNFIAELLPFVKNMPEAEKQILCSEVLQPIVRKTAHFSVYTLLGFLTMNFALTYKGTKYQQGLCSFAFCSLYAISDEIHQLFVQGRSGEIRDVCIDSLGVLTGILLTIFIMSLRRNILCRGNYHVPKKSTLNKDTKILFISSTGGHFSELMQLKPLMEKCRYHIVTEKTKTNSNLKDKYGNKIDFLLYETKKRPFRYFFVLLANCFISLYVYLKIRPQVIITTGTHTAGPMCCIAKILGSKVIFIETFANRKTKTVTGKLLYLIADTFIVQWEEMLEIYPKAKCLGWIY